MTDSRRPREFAGEYASIDHLALLAVRDLWGEWRYSEQSNRWFRRVGEQWVPALPPRDVVQQVVDRVIADAEAIPGELREERGVIDLVLARVLARPAERSLNDFRIWCHRDPVPGGHGAA